MFNLEGKIFRFDLHTSSSLLTLCARIKENFHENSLLRGNSQKKIIRLI